MRQQIEQIIRQAVSVDIHFDLCGTDRAAGDIADFVASELIAALREELRRAPGAYGDGLYEAIDLVQARLTSA